MHSTDFNVMLAMQELYIYLRSDGLSRELVGLVVDSHLTVTWRNSKPTKYIPKPQRGDGVIVFWSAMTGFVFVCGMGGRRRRARELLSFMARERSAK